jgi:type IV secretory pathway component VirB8
VRADEIDKDNSGCEAKNRKRYWSTNFILFSFLMAMAMIVVVMM